MSADNLVIPPEIQECAILGAKKLDSIRPGWAEWIDENKLNIVSETDCIIGQLMGNYVLYKELNLSTSELSRLGFDTQGLPWFPDERALLNEAWKKEIRRRAKRK